MFKVGDPVDCVDARACDYITPGKMYAVLAVCADHIRIISDVGLLLWFGANRFKRSNAFAARNECRLAIVSDGFSSGTKVFGSDGVEIKWGKSALTKIDISPISADGFVNATFTVEMVALGKPN